MKISAIISTYNRAKFLPGLFDSLKNQSLPVTDFEVLIINNNSTDDTELLSNEFVKNSEGLLVRYFLESEQGLSIARNRGITEAYGELVTFIDDDALPGRDFLEKNVEFFRLHPEAGAAGGKILLQFIGEKPAWYNKFLAPLLGYFTYGERTRLFKNNYFRGSNMTYRKSLFSQFEPFNITLGRTGEKLTGGEEKELFYRLKRNSVQLWYNPETVVYHLVPPERTKADFIRRQATGTGQSKKIQARIEGRIAILKAYISEDLRWGASIFISLFYFLTLRFSKGIMIIKFRYWVTKALITF